MANTSKAICIRSFHVMYSTVSPPFFKEGKKDFAPLRNKGKQTAITSVMAHKSVARLLVTRWHSPSVPLGTLRILYHTQEPLVKRERSLT